LASARKFPQICNAKIREGIFNGSDIKKELTNGRNVEVLHGN